MMPRAALFVGFLATLVILLSGLLLAGQKTAARHAEVGSIAKRQLVEQLGLTDLSLWSEARYTRHPSQADLFTPFQDYPAASDHFPAGSVVAAAQPKPDQAIRVLKKGQH